MNRVIFAGLLGAVVVFLWGWISWGALPWHKTTMPDLPNEDTVVETLRNNVTATGVYQFPGLSGVDEPTWQEKYQRGPVGLLVYNPKGKSPWNPMPIVFGFVLNFLAAFFAAWLLSLAVPKLASYTQRALFVCVLGVLRHWFRTWLCGTGCISRPVTV